MQGKAMQAWWTECKQKIGEAPRKFSLWDELTYLPIKRPVWCGSSDHLSVFFGLQREILHHGTLTWCHLVQANQLMFKPGMSNCPGEVVFQLGETPNLAALEYTAHSMYRLKETEPEDPEKAVIARRLTDEMERSYGAPVPASISGAQGYLASVVFFARHHLPDRKLSMAHFPILVHNKNPRAAMVVPSKFWPDSLVAQWCR